MQQKQDAVKTGAMSCMDITKNINEFFASLPVGSIPYSLLEEILHKLNRERSCHRERLDLQLGKIETLITIVDKLEKAVYPSAVVKDEDLKPCPFCGFTEIRIDSDTDNRFSYYCANCNAHAAWLYAESNARSAWQRRPND